MHVFDRIVERIKKDKYIKMMLDDIPECWRAPADGMGKTCSLQSPPRWG